MTSARAIAVLLLAVCVAALPLAPVAHAHEAGDTHDAPSLLVHTHGEAHHHGHREGEHRSHAPNGRGAPHGHDAVEHSDEAVVLTLDPVIAVPHTYVCAAPVPAVTILLLEPPRCERMPVTTYVERLTHSPPRAPAALRGPPSSSRL